MVEKLKNILLSKEFQKFFVVGVSAFLIDFVILSFQVYILHFQPTILGFIVVPNLISTSISIVFNFSAQKYWTFKTHEKGNAAAQGGKFLMVQIANLIIFNTLLFGFVAQFGVPLLIDKVFVTALQMVDSYILYKFFVFKNKPVKLEPDELIQ